MKPHVTLLFQIRLFIANMTGVSTRVTRSSGSRAVIEIPNGERNEPLSTELLQSLMCMGFGRPVWQKLEQAHNVQTDRGVWAAVAVKVSPGAVNGSRWVAKGTLVKTLSIKDMYSNEDLNADEQISLKCELEEFEFPADTGTRNTSDWKDLLEDQGTTLDNLEEGTEDLVRETGLWGRIVIVPTSVKEAELRLQVVPMKRADLQEKCEKATVALSDLSIPAMTVVQHRANLVPQVTEGRGGDSGFGLLPVMWSDSTVNMEDAEMPSTAMLKEELFRFLHQTMEPETIITKANWLKAWKAKWKRPRVPQPLWPNPPATVASVNTGKKTLCQSRGSNAMSMSEQGDLQP